MPSRGDLHKLVDMLPEGAFDAAQRTLQYLQNWPPIPPPEIAEMSGLPPQERLARLREKFVGGSGSGRIRPGYDGQKGRRGVWSARHSEGDVAVHEAHHFFDEHEFTIIESFTPEERGLVYRHEITAPNGRSDRREIIFPIKLAPGSCAL
jgi:hypothetical protein